MLVRIARALAASGDFDTARSVLLEIRSVVSAITDDWRKADALARIAETLVTNGDSDAARSLHLVVRSVADEIAATQMQKSLVLAGVAKALGYIAAALAINDDLDAARSVIGEIADGEEKAEALGRLAKIALEHASAKHLTEIVVDCAHFHRSTYDTAVAMSRSHPNHATEIAEVVATSDLFA